MVTRNRLRATSRSNLLPSLQEQHVVRRRLTVRRLDPWSVLKFGAVANLALLAIGLLVAGVVWFVIDRLALVDQVCSIALDVGFTECGINAGNLFRAMVLLGLLWVVVQTAVLVFLSFLHNLIADLTGGLTLTVVDDSPVAAAGAETTTQARRITTASTPPAPARQQVPAAARPAKSPAEPTRRGSTDQPTRPQQPQQPKRPQQPVPSASAPTRDQRAAPNTQPRREPQPAPRGEPSRGSSRWDRSGDEEDLFG
jgi:hypothetical protein